MKFSYTSYKMKFAGLMKHVMRALTAHCLFGCPRAKVAERLLNCLGIQEV